MMTDAEMAEIEQHLHHVGAGKHNLTTSDTWLAALVAEVRRLNEDGNYWSGPVVCTEHADRTGHLHRCAKVSGVWACHLGCAVAERDAARRDVAALQEALDALQAEIARQQHELACLYEWRMIRDERDALERVLRVGKLIALSPEEHTGAA